ncbi:MAG: cyclase family protein [Spirochaetota bacterium]
MKIIDLSSTIENSPDAIPDFLKIQVDYHSHEDGAMQVETLLNVPRRLFRNDEGWATETITKLGTHDATHVDAPWHYNSEIGGARAQTIDELPLEWFFADGVKLDMTHKDEGDPVTVGDIEKELERINYSIKPMDIVLIYTGRDRFYGQPDYIFKGCGVTAEATRWLFEQGVRVMGIDAWGWDVPLNLQAREALKKDEKGIFWQAHQVDLPYSHMERLVNLGEVPASGFKVACFPLKIKDGSAAPARVVAIINE